MASKPSATCQGTSFVRSCPPDRLPGQAVALGITLSLDSCVVAVRGGAHQEGVVHKEAQGLGGGREMRQSCVAALRSPPSARSLLLTASPTGLLAC